MANKRVGVTLDINADISQVRTAATEMQKIFSSMNLDGKNSAGITKLISNLDKALIELEQKSNTALSGLGDSNAVEKSIGKVNGIINSLLQEFQLLGKNAPKDLAAAVQGFSDKMAQATQFQKDYAAAIKKTESEAKDLGKAQTDAIDKVDAAQKKYDATLTKQLQKEKEIADLRKQVEDRNKSKDLGILRKNQLNYQQQVEDAKSAIKQIAQEYENIRINKSGLINGQDIEKLSADDLELYRVYAAQLESMGPAAQEAKKALEDYNAETARISKSADSSQKDLDKINDTLSTQASELDGAKDKLKKATEAINQFNEAGKKADAFDELKNKLAGLFGDDSLKNVKNIDELKNALEQLATTAGGDVASKIRQAISALGQTEGPLNRSAAAARKTGESFKKMSEAEQEINHLTSRLKYFFSLAGGFQLMRRAIRSAVDTTKELDAVMTQTAVVSDYSVGDMWKTLPQYSKYAKQLGAEIKDVYSAQTLYVQQGLNMNDAMDLGIETLKMARVAGIDAAEATNSMTAALRGFNMELTETSAVRINDVYSKLAQNTASNVQEISTAMSKVAALANSANMSFENTSAFLATIIESTREGAETAGTALKTVIARFTEVKKLYNEGELTGTDEEGQEVDVNKISKALRTAGINMNDFFTGAKGLDEIFMELGSKWSGLTTVQQRYIATMAAGSRQQSRFLALMQNYSRTVELTQMAYNSAGSGQEQFEKTLDSLEAKLNQLKAAWDTFTMGIANSDFIKGIIDAGTKILEILNKIIDTVSGGNGAIKSILSLTAAFGAFKIGGAIFKGGLGKIGQMISIGAKKGVEEPQNIAQRYQQVKIRARNRIVDTKEGFQYSFFNKNGKANRQAIIDAENNAKQMAQAAKKAYDTEVDKLNQLKSKGFTADEIKAAGGQKQAKEKRAQEIAAQEQEVQNKENELNATNQTVNTTAQNSTKAMQQYGAAMQAAGVAAGVLAGVLGLVANKLKKAGKTNAAKVFEGLATGVGVLSAALTLCGSMFMAFGAAAKAGSAMAATAIKSIPFIGWAAAIISALVAVISIISEFTETSEEKMQRLEDSTKNAKEIAESATEAYEELLSGKDKYHELLDQLSELQKGTEEYRDTLIEINQLVHDLAIKYPNLEYSFNKKTGALEINEDSLNKEVELAKQRALSLQGTSELVGLQETLVKYDQNLDQGTRQARKATEYGWSIQSQMGNNSLVRLYSTADLSMFSDEEKLAIAKLSKERINELYDQAKDEIGYSTFLGFGDNEKAQEVTKKYEELLKKEIKGLGTSVSKDKQQLDSVYQNALFAQSDQSEEAFAVSKLYGVNGKTYYKKTADWKEWDLDDLADTGEGRRWDQIIDAALEQGFINEIEAVNYKQRTDFENTNYINEELYEKITGKEAGSYQDTVNYLGHFYEAQLASQQLKIDQEKFESLSPNIQQGFEDLISRPEELTASQIQDLLDKWSSLEQLEGIDPEILKSYHDELVDLSTSWIENGLQYSKLYSRSAEKQWKKFDQYGLSDKYEKIFKDIEYDKRLDEQQKKTILSVFNSSDITSITDLWKTFDVLKESGIDLEKIAPDLYNSFKDVINILDQSGIAIKKWSAESATDTIKNTRGLANNLKDSGTRDFTKEQFQQIKEAFENTEFADYLNNFIEQTDGNYKFVGEDLNTIISALYAIADKIPNEYTERVQAEKKASDYVSNKLKDRTATNFNQEAYNASLERVGRARGAQRIAQSDYDFALEYGTQEEIAEAKANLDAATEEFNAAREASKEATKVSRENLNNLSDEEKAKLYNEIAADAIDENGNNLFKAAGLSTNVDASTVGDYWEKFLDLAFNNAEITETAKNTLQRQSLIGASSAQLANASLGQAVTGYNEKGEAIVDKEAYTKENQELAGNALDTAVEEENLNEVVERSNELFKVNGEIQEDVAQALKVNALDAKKAEKEFDDLSSAIKDNNTALKSKDPQTRQRALDNIAKAAKKAFGDNKKITSKFVEDNEKAFEDYANGVDGAEDRIRTALGTELANDFKMSEKNASGLQETIDNMANTKFNVDGTADFTNIFNQLLALELSAEEAASVLSSLGYTVTWVADGVVYDDINNVPVGSNYKVVVTDSAGNAVNRNRGGGGGGGGGKKEFKNDFDKYYNMVEDINELERLRNLLETDYNQLLESEAASGKAIYDNLKKQVDLLKERRDITADLAEKRKQQIIDETKKKENSDLAEFAWWNEEDQTIEIDWDKINAVKDSELGDRIKEFVSTLEGFQSKYDEQIEALEDIESTLQEIEKRGRDQYTSLEDRVRDALIQQIQTQIDELTAVNEGISEANQKLFDSIQNTLELQRQERDNAKIEEELSNKEQRLAYLQQDSSGANALEIAQLQEELADARESYTDQLIDQKISELQKQNDEAAEQRQEQIDLLQQSLDWQEKNGEFWEQAYQLMNNGIGPDGTLVTGSELEQLLKQGEGWQALSQEGKMNWLSDLETMVAEAVGYLYLSRQLEKIGTKAGTEITFTDAEGNTHTGKVDKDGNVVIDNGDGTQTVWKDVYQSYDGSYRTLETEENAKTENKPATSTKPGGSGSGSSSGPGDSSGNTETWENIGNKSYHDLNNSEHEIWQDQKSSKGHFRTQKTREAHNNYKRIDTGNTQTCYCDKCGHYMGIISKTGGASSSGNGGGGTGLDNKVMTRYATGGLNTKTGPAWLDGTPSRPELILSARDTENFIQLKDTLADLRKNSASLGINGDNYYEISINVDEIGSDYDVDKLADRLRTLIYRDSQYRNVNTLNRLR